MSVENNYPRLVELHNSLEHWLFRDLKKISDAYMALVNGVVTGDDRRAVLSARLDELRTAAREMKERSRIGLYEKHHMPDDCIVNVNDRTLPELDNLYLNVGQFYMHFLHAQDETGKLRSLTALYHLLCDFVEVAEITPVERYLREIIK